MADVDLEAYLAGFDDSIVYGDAPKATGPDAYSHIFEEAANTYGHDPNFLRATAWQESRFNPKAVGPPTRYGNAKGMMQIIDATAADLGVTDAHDPWQAIMGGALYLRQMEDKFGSKELALAAYNSGPGNVQKYGGIPPFAETQQYVPSIMAKYKEFQQLYPTKPPPEVDLEAWLAGFDESTDSAAPQVAQPEQPDTQQPMVAPEPAPEQPQFDWVASGPGAAPPPATSEYEPPSEAEQVIKQTNQEKGEQLGDMDPMLQAEMDFAEFTNTGFKFDPFKKARTFYNAMGDYSFTPAQAAVSGMSTEEWKGHLYHQTFAELEEKLHAKRTKDPVLESAQLKQLTATKGQLPGQGRLTDEEYAALEKVKQDPKELAEIWEDAKGIPVGEIAGDFLVGSIKDLPLWIVGLGGVRQAKGAFKAIKTAMKARKKLSKGTKVVPASTGAPARAQAFKGAMKDNPEHHANLMSNLDVLPEKAQKLVIEALPEYTKPLLPKGVAATADFGADVGVFLTADAISTGEVPSVESALATAGLVGGFKYAPQILRKGRQQAQKILDGMVPKGRERAVGQAYKARGARKPEVGTMEGVARKVAPEQPVSKPGKDVVGTKQKYESFTHEPMPETKGLPKAKRVKRTHRDLVRDEDTLQKLESVKDGGIISALDMLAKSEVGDNVTIWAVEGAAPDGAKAKGTKIYRAPVAGKDGKQTPAIYADTKVNPDGSKEITLYGDPKKWGEDVEAVILEELVHTAHARLKELAEVEKVAQYIPLYEKVKEIKKNMDRESWLMDDAPGPRELFDKALALNISGVKVNRPIAAELARIPEDVANGILELAGLGDIYTMGEGRAIRVAPTSSKQVKQEWELGKEKALQEQENIDVAVREKMEYEDRFGRIPESHREIAKEWVKLLRLNAYKKAKRGGQEFQEHIPAMGSASGSDVVATEIGMDEPELMAILMKAAQMKKPGPIPKLSKESEEWFKKHGDRAATEEIAKEKEFKGESDDVTHMFSMGPLKEPGKVKPQSVIPLAPPENQKVAKELIEKKLTPPKDYHPPNEMKLIEGAVKANKKATYFAEQVYKDEQKDAWGLLRSWEKAKDSWIGAKDVRILKSKSAKKRLQGEVAKALNQKRYTFKAKAYDMALDIAREMKQFPAHRPQFWNMLSQKQRFLVKLAEKLPENLKGVNKKIGDRYAGLGEEGLDANVLMNLRENYAARVWNLKSEDSALNALGKKFGIKTKHALPRKFDTIIEGWAAGYDLKVEGATNRLQIYEQEMVRVLEDKRFIKNLMKVKDLDGRPLLTEQNLPGYKQVEHPNFKIWKHQGKVEKGKMYGRDARVTEDGDVFVKIPLYAPKEQANNLNNILGSSALNKVPGVKALTRYNAEVKAWVLQSSLFHVMAFVRSYLLGTNNKKFADLNPISAYREGLRLIIKEHPILMHGVRNGLTLDLRQDWEEALLHTKSIPGKLIDKVPYIRTVKDFVLFLRDVQANWLFGSMGAGLKAKSFLIEYAHYIKVHPTADPDIAAKSIAKLINADFGGLHLGRMGRNPIMQHIFRLFALAPDWTESNINTMVKSLLVKTPDGRYFSPSSQWMKELKRKLTDPEARELYNNFNREKGEKGFVTKEQVDKFVEMTGFAPHEVEYLRREAALFRRFWAHIIAKLVIANVTLNYVISKFDDKDFIERYRTAWGEDGNWKKLNWTGIDITPIYKGLGGDSDERKYWLSPGHFGDLLKFPLQPIKSAHHKGSIIFRSAFEALTGEDWAGRRFTTASELLGEGKLTTWDYGKKGALSYETAPSYILHQARQSQPIQAQLLYQWLSGEAEGFDAITKSLGLRTRTTYKGKKKKTGSSGSSRSRSSRSSRSSSRKSNR